MTDAGLPYLARLPKLREVSFHGVPGVTLQGTAVLPGGRARRSFGLRGERPWHLLICALAGVGLAQPAPSQDVARWQRQAQDVTITRDDRGIHVKGKTDADAVFGLMYAQAEDDFNRIETNYLNALGRQAEGESAVYRDLRMKLFIDPDEMKGRHAESPAWLKTLMQAWADGLNYYLHTHAQVKPRVLRQFEPWMALSFTEGSIGGDIERVNLAQLEAFYGKRREVPAAGEAPDHDEEPRGSNGIAIAPSNTKTGRALLLINPHTSFYFRAEAQMSSDAGLNAYGALTWASSSSIKFNERAGWMHTSSGVDAWTNTSRHGQGRRPAGLPLRRRAASRARVPNRRAVQDGGRDGHEGVHRLPHAPRPRRARASREVGQRAADAGARESPLAVVPAHQGEDYRSFRETMELHTNSSNNTIFADALGTIAYFHANFIPRRDRLRLGQAGGRQRPRHGYGAAAVDESPNLLNPKSGWLFNVNNWPWSAAGASSPRRESDYPAYVERGSAESARGRHAIRVLQGRTDFTLDSLVAAAYDSTCRPSSRRCRPGRGVRRPPGRRCAEGRARRADRARAWVGLPLVGGIRSHHAGDHVGGTAEPAARQRVGRTAARGSRRPRASWRRITGRGRRRGSVNRFQRLDGAIAPSFDDAAPSLPVGFPSARWGSLASFGARAYKNTKRIYGSSGNSFVAVVEFGERVRARAVSAGGQSGDPASRHFNDQALRYGTGDLRRLLPSLGARGHIEREYHPGR